MVYHVNVTEHLVYVQTQFMRRAGFFGNLGVKRDILFVVRLVM